MAIEFRTYREEWGTDTEYFCYCDKCGQETNEEDMFEYEGEIFCTECLKKMFPYKWDDELGDCLEVDGKLVPVEDLEDAFKPVDPWDIKWAEDDGYDPDYAYDKWRDEQVLRG